MMSLQTFCNLCKIVSPMIFSIVVGASLAVYSLVPRSAWSLGQAPDCKEILCVWKGFRNDNKNYPDYCFSPSEDFIEYRCHGLSEVPEVHVNDTIYSAVLTHNTWKTLDDDLFDELSEITSLELSNNKIEVIEDDAMEEMERLTYLSLANNRLKKIPKIWSQNLKIFHFEGNNMDSIYVQNLGRAGGQLKYMDMSKNKIEAVQERAFKETPKLVELYLDGNKINTLAPMAFENLRELRVLTLTENKIVQISSNTFDKTTKLKTLNLAHNEIRNIETEAFNRIREYGSRINLSHNKIREFETNVFHGSLGILDLRENRLLTCNTKKNIDNKIRVYYPGQDCFQTTKIETESTREVEQTTKSPQSKVCKDVCKNGASCIPKSDAALCICKNGYEGDTCTEDVDECQHKPCKHGGFCTNLPGSYSCTCRQGWKGKRCNIERTFKESTLPFTNIVAYVLLIVFAIGVTGLVWWYRVSKRETALLGKLLPTDASAERGNSPKSSAARHGPTRSHSRPRHSRRKSSKRASTYYK